MTGCDRCGAQALSGEVACPVCGLGLPALAGPGGRQAPHIPVRRHGTIPLPPWQVFGPAQDRGARSLLALALGALGAALIAAAVGYWLW
ncbi:MAG: hypothetical protein JWP65_1043 [Ramlibacter sp.]|jgi:hypothetical protein|uniref:hypothetical protein n=1 Tax=Ramlibacter sp. TaxID=1917967 RepID=UPI00260F4DB8|nr:hypothetical protein [Ramlibacter sp.]MDB5750622.1 hypothetical protein [Ramlibacter sp.]